jgi:hypothetical protein
MIPVRVAFAHPVFMAECVTWNEQLRSGVVSPATFRGGTMSRERVFAVLLTLMALTGCVQPGQASYAPYARDDPGSIRGGGEGGGGGGGGGGGSGM